MKISEIKEILASDAPRAEQLEEIKADQRAGVQKLYESYLKRLAKLEEKKEDFQNRLSYERAARAKGATLIAGIDEVGRGPLAGPVVAAAVILPEDFDVIEVNDSKKVPKNKHQEISDKILEQAIAVGVGVVSPATIDQINIYEASKLAMVEAVTRLATDFGNGEQVVPDYLLVDAMELPTKTPQDKIIKGDAKSVSIAAASIVAKVVRDGMMAEYDKAFPGYGFTQNAGYGTALHLEGLEKYGITPIHRLTFEPIKSMVNK
ncbi:MAG: ribonuclease HII [Lactobacillales bacterium]|jgi:ribonuclease HII|nr:ribonuclease HII [Lactobacillales bacterium]